MGSLSLVLHAHLPYVRHPEHPTFLEEDWLFEAIAETYVPLLAMLDGWEQDGVPGQITMSVTPPLAEMLADPLLQGRARRWLDQRLALATELLDGPPDAALAPAIAHAQAELARVQQLFVEAWGCALLPRFRHHLEAGRLELITCTATHGLLPLMATPEARHAQVELACRTHARHFGVRPQGIWLAECAWAPGLDELLAACGIRWFLVEEGALTGASPPARLGTARPVRTPAGVAAFGRDPTSSRQVWSATDGYPGDPSYRDFYRDAGWDLPYAQVQPLLHGDGRRRGVGIKLHRVTGAVDLGDKQPYLPREAARQAREHARHFVDARVQQVRELRAQLGCEPHLTAPYDAELYGHWWAEGPVFLDAVVRELATREELVLESPPSFLSRQPAAEALTPARSTWGAGGTYEVWLNGGNAWIYRHLHEAEHRMVALVEAHGSDPAARCTLAQLGRELLMAQASDWAFILTMDTSVGYAERRTREHLATFHALADGLQAGEPDLALLAEREHRLTAFPDLDPDLWRAIDGDRALRSA